jgi:tRNA A-37 threonylcarbamoyl transferase component Bud32
MVLKFFPADSARMLSEIHAYRALQPVQGSAIPQCIGVFTVGGFRGYALGLCAVDGVTLRQHFGTEVPSIELFRLVWSQLRAMHDCGVAHMDVRAENILIKHDRSVVIIDFSTSL